MPRSQPGRPVLQLVLARFLEIRRRRDAHRGLRTFGFDGVAQPGHQRGQSSLRGSGATPTAGHREMPERAGRNATPATGARSPTAAASTHRAELANRRSAVIEGIVRIARVVEVHAVDGVSPRQLAHDADEMVDGRRRNRRGVQTLDVGSPTRPSRQRRHVRRVPRIDP